jgi:transcriptional regulator with XRE-family HTH domain
MGQIALLVGEKIRDLRKQRGLSQESLALKAGINTSYLGQIERAEKSATIDTLEKITFALDVELEHLFRLESRVKGNKEMSFLDKINFELRSRTDMEQEAVYRFIKQLLWFRDKR